MLGAACAISHSPKGELIEKFNKGEEKDLYSLPIKTNKSSLERDAKTKDIEALKEIYNIKFNQRNIPNIHASLASESTILLKIQQHELINSAQTKSDFIEEKFNVNISIENVKIVTPNGNVIQPSSIHRKSKISASLKQGDRFILDHFFYLNLPQGHFEK